MTSIAYSPVSIQASAHSVPTPPCWFGEVTLIAQHLRREGVLAAIEEQVHFARRRFGRYEVIDFVVVLIGYAISGERTLEAFYKQLQPWASAFMALFGRDRLPARSTLSRFLAALDQAAVEALRTLFQQDLLARPLVQGEVLGGFWDRAGTHYLVFDVDGTREAARQRALPQTEDRPSPQRRLREVCAPGYTGRKRGEVARTRTTVLQMHTHQWLATFGNPGNGQYREELRRAVAVIQSYVQAHDFPEQQALIRLDGQYGTGAVVADLAGLAYVTRGKDYRLLDRGCPSRPVCTCQKTSSSPIPKAGRCAPSTTVRSSSWADQGSGSGSSSRPIQSKRPRVGSVSPRSGVVYELFLTNLPQGAFTAADVVALYVHRGAFENALPDEDQEQEPDRWCSYTECGQELWQIACQWVWNLRLELGHQLHPDPVRTTEFAPAHLSAPDQEALSPSPLQGYGPRDVALPWKQGRFSGRDFVPQPDGTLRCPAGQSLRVHERRREADGSLRAVYAASIRSCRPCPLREQCQWQGRATKKPRQVSVLLHPLVVGSAPLLWRDWSRRFHRRACMQLLRGQRLEVQMEPPLSATPDVSPAPLSRAQRAHYRLSFQERLARNARAPTAGPVTIKLFGIPEAFAAFLGLAMA